MTLTVVLGVLATAYFALSLTLLLAVVLQDRQRLRLARETAFAAEFGGDRPAVSRTVRFDFTLPSPRPPSASGNALVAALLLPVQLAAVYLGFAAGSCALESPLGGRLSTDWLCWSLLAIVAGAMLLAIADLLLSIVGMAARRVRVPRLGAWVTAIALFSLFDGALVAAIRLAGFYGVPHPPSRIGSHIAVLSATTLALTVPVLLAMRAAAATGVRFQRGVATALIVVLPLGLQVAIEREATAMTLDSETSQDLRAALIGEVRYYGEHRQFTEDPHFIREYQIQSDPWHYRSLVTQISVKTGDLGQTVCLSAVSPTGREIEPVITHVDLPGPQFGMRLGRASSAATSDCRASEIGSGDWVPVSTLGQLLQLDGRPTTACTAQA